MDFSQPALPIEPPRDPIEALRRLGLELEDLLLAIERGAFVRNSCTPHDATTAPGYGAWNATTRGLRDGLVRKGWTAEVINKLEAVVHPSRKHAIVVSTGNEDAGRQSPRMPRTKYRRGRASTQVIIENKRQLRLFGEPAIDLIARTPLMRWLLVSFDEDAVRSELSLPNEVAEDGTIVSWAQRIILPELPNDGLPPPSTTSGDGAPPDVLVDVTRRAG